MRRKLRLRGLGSRLGCLILLVPTPCHAQRFVADFEWCWETVKTQLYDATLAERFFNDANHAALLERARMVRSPEELAIVFNSLLDSLRLSHTRLFTPSDLEFYVLRSFTDKDTVTIPQAGAQWRVVDGSYRVQAVWDGYPAARAGLRRGDRVVADPAAPFGPILSFRSGRSTRLEVMRGGRKLRVRVTPVRESIGHSLRQAMSNSVRRIHVGRRRVGYVHLWSGTSHSILRDFTRIVTEDLADVDGIILDLRDGWGGAWYAYLDPFFPDRKDFFTATVLHRGERRVMPPDSVAAHPWFRGPLVVLINEGTRSGKEVMAFQFKKSKRAVLVGSTTCGAVVFGAPHPNGSAYMLYYAINGLWVDGQVLEGVGVAPDVRVEHPVDESRSGDPQYQRGLEIMRQLLAEQKKVRPG